MNLRFRDPYATEIPECIDGLMEDGCALNLRLNRWGTLLSAGCQDGRVVVWDVDTRSRAAVLPTHAAPVSCTAFSRCGFYLASCAVDGTISVTSLETQTTVVTYTALPPALTVQFHPRDATQLLVTKLSEPPVIMKIDYDAHTIAPLPVTETIANVLAEIVPKSDIANDSAVSEKAELKDHKPKKKKSRLGSFASASSSSLLPDPKPCFSAVYGRLGNKLYVGTSRGNFIECDPATGALVRPEPRKGGTDEATSGDASGNVGAGVKSIDLSRDGKHALLTCTDRCVRIFDLKTFTVVAELRDDVNHQQFRRCSFSPNAEYIASCSTTSDAHDLGVWTNAGRLLQNVKGLSGDRVVDVVWHPLRPLIFTCGSSGCIYAWSTIITERWRVYAPTFTELEENVEYVEKEDEFDFEEGEVPLLEDGKPAEVGPDGRPIVIPAKPAEPLKKVEEPSADEHLDITSIRPIPAYFSGSEDESAEAREPQLQTIMPNLKPFIYQDML